MQAALITYLPTAPNGTEPSGETVSAGYNTTGHKTMGQGMRISSAIQSGTNDTLFTKILEKGITIDAALNLSAGGIQLISDTDTVPEADGEESSDICSLLMQLMVMDSSRQAEGGDTSQKAQDEKALNGILSIINTNPDVSAGTAPQGLGTAASVILQNDGKAAEVLSALAADNNGQSAGLADEAPPSVPFEAVIAGITDALKNELNQQNTAQAAQTTVTKMAEAAGNAAAAVADTAGMGKSAGAISPALEAAKAENDGFHAAGGSEEVSVRDSSDPAAAIPDNENAGVSQAGGTADGDDGSMGSPDERGKRKDIGLSAVKSDINGAAPETGVNSETAAVKAFAVERALNRFADDIMSVRGGRQEIRIVLEPESLGVLTISVVKTESGISAKIKSEDREVAAIISDHVQKLISSMESKGITVNDVDVTYNQTEQNTGFTQNGFSQAREEASKGSALPPEEAAGDDASPELWQTLYGTEPGGDTTVDYRV
jgi:hypothetical protein